MQLVQQMKLKKPAFEVSPTKISCIFPLWYGPLTYDTDIQFNIDRVTVNHRAKYVGQKSFRSKVINETHRGTHTQATDCSTQPLMMGSKAISVCAFSVEAQL